MNTILLKLGDNRLNAKISNTSKIIGINTDDYSKCIELASMNFGMQQQMTTDVSNSARTSGRPNLNDISLTKVNDQSSLVLYQSCLQAMPIGSGKEVSNIFILRKEADNGGQSKLVKVFTLELTDAIISSIETQTNSDNISFDSFTINFSEIKWVYESQDDDPMFQNKVEFGWSVVRNRPF